MSLAVVVVVVTLVVGGAVATTYPDIDAIVEYIVSDSAQYERLGVLTDNYPSRMSSSQVLEDAIDWCYSEMVAEGMQAHTEDVEVPNWYHNHENDLLALLSPGMQRNLTVTALGSSIGTSGITATALVVSSFEELTNRSADAVGKIVVYDVPFTTYGEAAAYRWHGAEEAAKVGAVASLTMSVTSKSLYTLHKGDSITASIPAGSITTEDAAMLHRMQHRNTPPLLHLVLDCELRGTATSRNLIVDIPGTEIPNELVIVSGHFDTWDDYFPGAHDDGAGTFAAWQVVRALHFTGLSARRTIRAIFWTCEEFGWDLSGYGGESYAAAHASELGNYSLAIEMDSGAFAPSYWSFTGTDEAIEALQPVVEQLNLYGMNTTVIRGPAGVDTEAMERAGVPAMTLEVDVTDTTYYSFHHTRADSFDKVAIKDFNDCSAALAVMTKMVADMDTLLPRTQAKNPKAAFSAGDF
ncbi:peptidase M28 family protein [Pelomyxa schiedti]|nr:peptidase M28 family protein [Pelomyxa schiedti]